jgi:ring-1,2-phenylacetyl-CoA epoxidase subunit PaaC
MASRTSEPAGSPELQVVADACLIASHRLTEWVSNAPTMEEDVALGNIALDLLGQARGLFSHLGDEDELAYFRDAAEWRNPIICELPNGDFGFTMLRQLILDGWLSRVWPQFAVGDDEVVRGVAEKAIKENTYHLRHSSSWVVRLGDGTEESHRRMRVALDELWPYTAELTANGWYDVVAGVLVDATLPAPTTPRFDGDTPSADGVSPSNRVKAAHSAHLVTLLDEMQSLARAHRGAAW